MRILDQVITTHEAAELIGGYSPANIKKVQRRCNNGTYTARLDSSRKPQWLILKSSVLDKMEVKDI